MLVVVVCMCVCVQVRRTPIQSPTMPEELLEGRTSPVCTVWLCLCFNDSSAMTIPCWICAPVHHFCLYYQCIKAKTWYCDVQVCARLMILYYLLSDCMHPCIHLCIHLHGCASLNQACVEVCVCVWKCGWLWSEWERGTTREGERKRERKMREVWELNGQTRCPDVLGHAVSLASFCHSTGFFKFWVEVLAAALHIRFKRHMFFLTSSVVSKGNVCMRVEYNL